MINKEVTTRDVIGKSYEDVKTFNDIAGNLTGDMRRQVDNQLGFIFEELQETIEAFETQNEVALADGADDLLVVVFGLIQKLEAAGFDMAKAIAKVDAINLSKMPSVGQALQYDSKFKVSLNEKHSRYVIKDETGKVRKPSNFVPVDLSDCVPENFFK